MLVLASPGLRVPPGGSGGSTLLYTLYRYVLPDWVGFLVFRCSGYPFLYFWYCDPWILLRWGHYPKLSDSFNPCISFFNFLSTGLEPDKFSMCDMQRNVTFTLNVADSFLIKWS